MSSTRCDYCRPLARTSRYSTNSQTQTDRPIDGRTCGRTHLLKTSFNRSVHIMLVSDWSKGPVPVFKAHLHPSRDRGHRRWLYSGAGIVADAADAADAWVVGRDSCPRLVERSKGRKGVQNGNGKGEKKENKKKSRESGTEKNQNKSYGTTMRHPSSSSII